MRNFKRFLALALSALMLAGCFSLFSGAQFADVDDYEEGTARAINTLAALNILKGFNEDEFKPEDNVARYQMAIIVAKTATGLCYADQAKEDAQWKTASATTSSFKDVVEGHYLGAIDFCANMGYIVGRDAASFDPDATVTFQEALTMFVRALGYETESVKKGYPWKYIEMAETLGLTEGLEGVLYTTPLTRAQAAQVTYNALFCQRYISGDFDALLGNLLQNRLTALNSFAAAKFGYEETTLVIGGFTAPTNSLGEANANRKVNAYGIEYEVLRDGSAITGALIDYDIDDTYKLSLNSFANFVLDEADLTDDDALALENGGEIDWAKYITYSNYDQFIGASYICGTVDNYKTLIRVIECGNETVDGEEVTVKNFNKDTDLSDSKYVPTLSVNGIDYEIVDANYMNQTSSGKFEETLLDKEQILLYDYAKVDATYDITYAQFASDWEDIYNIKFYDDNADGYYDRGYVYRLNPMNTDYIQNIGVDYHLPTNGLGELYDDQYRLFDADYNEMLTSSYPGKVGYIVNALVPYVMVVQDTDAFSAAKKDVIRVSGVLTGFDTKDNRGTITIEDQTYYNIEGIADYASFLRRCVGKKITFIYEPYYEKALTKGKYAISCNDLLVYVVTAVDKNGKITKAAATNKYVGSDGFVDLVAGADIGIAADAAVAAYKNDTTFKSNGYDSIAYAGSDGKDGNSNAYAYEYTDFFGNTKKIKAIAGNVEVGDFVTFITYTVDKKEAVKDPDGTYDVKDTDETENIIVCEAVQSAGGIDNLFAAVAAGDNETIDAYAIDAIKKSSTPIISVYSNVAEKPTYVLSIDAFDFTEVIYDLSTYKTLAAAQAEDAKNIETKYNKVVKTDKDGKLVILAEADVINKGFRIFGADDKINVYYNKLDRTCKFIYIVDKSGKITTDIEKITDTVHKYQITSNYNSYDVNVGYTYPTVIDLDTGATVKNVTFTKNWANGQKVEIVKSIDNDGKITVTEKEIKG